MKLSKILLFLLTLLCPWDIIGFGDYMFVHFIA